ncbi:MAG: hypothetical protein VKK62_00740 [Synechococcaceae cyanobacterium]|nr:hypothetical protein [Synechococcaceae cyanobacterium]
MSPSLLSVGIAMLMPSLVAIDSPWWENYDAKDRYLCNDRMVVVIERNEAQASLFTRGMRSTLFRDNQSSAGLLYRNDVFKVVLKGDELMLDQSRIDPFNPRITCVRTEDA